jgi:hypothetical protein
MKVDISAVEAFALASAFEALASAFEALALEVDNMVVEAFALAFVEHKRFYKTKKKITFFVN